MPDGARAVLARRAARHGLTVPVAPERLADQVGAIGGAHAQVMSAAETSIGLRVAGTTRDDVRTALWTDRTLVKAHGPRGTVHLLPSAHLGRWVAALSALAVVPVGDVLTPAQVELVVDALAGAVGGAAEPLTVDELGAAVAERVGPWALEPGLAAFGGAWPRWRAALVTAAHRGVLCGGPARGRHATYTSPGPWADLSVPPDADTASEEVLRAYLGAYGPATARDFAAWFGTTDRAATDLFARLRDRLEPSSVDAAPGWVWAGDPVTDDHPAPGVRLLPHFDAYVVGGRPRPLLFPGEAAARGLKGGQAGTVPVVLRDGEVVGVWHGRRAGRRLELTVELLAGAGTRAVRAAVEEQADRLGAIGGAEPRVAFGPVTAGKHL
ncbi:MAG TPA: winged helix DNA-binding domain-containing protein [Actinomycetospora sp.]|nr:winged helix DNA-binding domain-containing protein [Actinomycetospora sp.]